MKKNQIFKMSKQMMRKIISIKKQNKTIRKISQLLYKMKIYIIVIIQNNNYNNKFFKITLHIIQILKKKNKKKKMNSNNQKNILLRIQRIHSLFCHLKNKFLKLLKKRLIKKNKNNNLNNDYIKFYIQKINKNFLNTNV